MATDDAPQVPAGDHSHGGYWSATRPSGEQAKKPSVRWVGGSVIRMMWDYGVRIPLWDAKGSSPRL